MLIVVTGRAIVMIAALQILSCTCGVRILLAARLGEVGATGETNHICAEAMGI